MQSVCGIRKTEVKTDFKKAEFVEKDGKKYVVVKKKCNC